MTAEEAIPQIDTNVRRPAPSLNVSNISHGMGRADNQGFALSSVAMNSNRVDSNLGMSE